MFRGTNFGDKVRFDLFSLAQWLALLPRSVVAKPLHVRSTLVAQELRDKQIIVASTAK